MARQSTAASSAKYLAYMSHDRQTRLTLSFMLAAASSQRDTALKRLKLGRAVTDILMTQHDKDQYKDISATPPLSEMGMSNRDEALIPLIVSICLVSCVYPSFGFEHWINRQKAVTYRACSSVVRP